MQPRKKLLTIILAFTAAFSLAAASTSILPDTLTNKQRYSTIASLLEWKADPDSNLCGGSYGQPKRLNDTTAPADFNQVTSITSKGPNFLKLSGASILKNQVIVKQPGREVHADLAHIYRDKTGKIKLIDLSGRVNLYENGKHIVTDHLKIRLPSQKIRATTVIYHLKSPGKTPHRTLQPWGTAASVRQDKHGVSSYNHATYTTCHPNNPTWIIQAKKLRLDQNEGVGTVHNALLRFKGVPILPLPYLQFPIDGRRRTGLLAPTYAYETSRQSWQNKDITNFIINVPYYLNLAPNYDDLMNFSWWSKRGFVFGNKFRYLNTFWTSHFNINWVPYDNLANDERTGGRATVNASSSYPPNAATQYINGLNDLRPMRWRVNWNNDFDFNDRWKANLNLNRVSDAYYFRDYSSMDDFANNLLRSNFLLNYVGNHWQDSFLVEDYQALHRYDQLDYGVNTPYERQPELTFSGFYGNWLNSPLDLSLTGELDNFRYEDPFNPDMVQGVREHARAELAYPIYVRGGSITPGVYVDLRSYQLTKNTTGFNTQKNYSIPLFDLDSQWTWGTAFHFFKRPVRNELTLHAYYVYIPSVNQDSTPNFDSYLLPYNYTQLFSLNRYTGYDKLSNANQVSLGLHDGIVDTATGGELASFDIGLANSFTTPRICLTPNCDLPTTHLSPLVTDVSVALINHWNLTASAAWNLNNGYNASYNTNDSSSGAFLKSLNNALNNASGSLQYNDGEQRLFSISYSYAPDAVNTVPETFWLPTGETNNITVGAGWPLSDRLRLMGYYAYDFYYDRSNLGFVGLEYNACCWRLKLVYRRLWDTSYYASNGSVVNNYHQNVMLSFELKGLGDAGTVGRAAAIKALETKIPGYDSDY